MRESWLHFQDATALLNRGIHFTGIIEKLADIGIYDQRHGIEFSRPFNFHECFV